MLNSHLPENINRVEGISDTNNEKPLTCEKRKNK